MIVFAAITPHSPLLLPTIGHDQAEELRDTRAACDALRKMFTEARPDAVLLISPHSTALPDAVVLNLADDYQGDLVQFGDLKTKRTERPYTAFIDQLQRALRKAHQPVTMLSVEALDYGAMVPLELLGVPEALPLILLFPAEKLDFKKLFAFGEALRDELTDNPKRIAVIVSSNLSHRLSSDTPAGFSPRGAEFDALVKEALETGHTSRLLKLKDELVEEAGQCGFRGIMILLGILSQINASARVLSYEHPFGVGYLTASFDLP